MAPPPSARPPQVRITEDLTETTAAPTTNTASMSARSNIRISNGIEGDVTET
jgi:hypothetical protein